MPRKAGQDPSVIRRHKFRWIRDCDWQRCSFCSVLRSREEGVFYYWFGEKASDTDEDPGCEERSARADPYWASLLGLGTKATPSEALFAFERLQRELKLAREKLGQDAELWLDFLATLEFVADANWQGAQSRMGASFPLPVRKVLHRLFHELGPVPKMYSGEKGAAHAP